MKNPTVTAVKNPTRYTGGKNAPVTAQKVPTRYTGGLNKAQCQAMGKK
jgi:hypothetical protein